MGEVPSDLLPPPASCCTERRAAIGYLDIVLVRQWEKSHQIYSLLQPTVVQKEEKVSTSLQLHILYGMVGKGLLSHDSFPDR
jgi:hypothetical protein